MNMFFGALSADLINNVLSCLLLECTGIPKSVIKIYAKDVVQTIDRGWATVTLPGSYGAAAKLLLENSWPTFHHGGVAVNLIFEKHQGKH